MLGAARRWQPEVKVVGTIVPEAEAKNQGVEARKAADGRQKIRGYRSEKRHGVGKWGIENQQLDVKGQETGKRGSGR